MLVEIHMLQNHAPSNLNRDDTGSPKDCIFGGIRRARISSQCLKRSIRRSPLFRQEVEDKLAIRTRQLPEQVKQRLLARGLSAELAEVAARKASGFGNKEGKEQKEPATAQTMFLTPADLDAVADLLYEEAQKAGTAKAFEKVPTKELQRSAALKGWRPITPDIALFGRMVTSDAFRDVQASVQVAHALSTHKMEHEFDYFTAVDDLQDPNANEDDKGADMIGEVEFNSACYYKYFSIDLDGLLDNLAGDFEGLGSGAAAISEAVDLVRRTVSGFLAAAVFTTPSGKQNSFAAHQLPDAILVEVREHATPVSYANAFVQPVFPQRSKDLVHSSIEALAEHAQQITHKFGLKSVDRLWFTTCEVDYPGVTACETLDDLTNGLIAALEGWPRRA